MKGKFEKVFVLLGAFIMCLSTASIANAYEWYPKTSGGTKGKAPIECLNLPREAQKDAISYTYGNSKAIGAYADVKVKYTLSPAGNERSVFKSDTDDYDAYAEANVTSGYPQKAEFNNTASSRYYGNYESERTMNF